MLETLNHGRVHPDDRPGVRRGQRGRAESQRERLAQVVKQALPLGIGQDELDAHFGGMPMRYWERVNYSELVWGLQAVHKFMNQLAAGDLPATRPVVEWRHDPHRGFTKVLVCTWDRLGLLAKVAACFTAVRLNIIRAEAYTRADDVVLDVFRVCDSEGQHVRDVGALEEMSFLLEGALGEPPPPSSIAARKLSRPKAWPSSIQFDNGSSPEYTVLKIEVADRLGLLRDILQALTDSGINVLQALVDTMDGVANDTFFVTDGDGKKIGAVRLQAVRDALRETLNKQ